MLKRYLIVIAAFTLVACGNEKPMDKKKAELDKLKKEKADIQKKIDDLQAQVKDKGDTIAQNLPVVAVTSTKLETFRHFLEVQGRVESDENIFVNAKVPGAMITQVKVNRGDKVRKGQVLATEDPGAMQETIDEVKNQLSLATTIYEKQKRLWDQKIGSEIQYLTAKNNKEAAEKRLATMQQQYSNYTLTAPIDGTVDDVTMKAGEAATPLAGIRIVNFAKSKLVADISENYISKINPGDEVMVYLPAIDKDIKTTVKVVGDVINPTSRTFLVELKPDPSASKDLRPNMSAVIKINDQTDKNVRILPLNAVQTDDKGSFVYAVQDKAGHKFAVKKPVKTGISYKDQIEVTDGLQDSDQIITTGYQNVVDGQEVRL
jgi:RND family efflux transporter MFP subunit